VKAVGKPAREKDDPVADPGNKEGSDLKEPQDDQMWEQEDPLDDRIPVTARSRELLDGTSAVTSMGYPLDVPFMIDLPRGSPLGIRL
jgi:hypothetical protein